MQEQVIVEVTEVMEIEVSMMIEDVINVGLLLAAWLISGGSQRGVT